MRSLSFIIKPLLTFSLLTGTLFSYGQNAEWTHFRGAGLNGIAETQTAPLHWTSDSNLVWKTNIHGKGWSSPVVFENQVWMTTASEDGQDLNAVCVDFESGNILFDIRLFTPDSVYRKHPVNSYATPTPCIEKGFVYVHFGSYGTACIRTSDGQIAWEVTDLNCNHGQGPASSPVIYKDKLIIHLEGTDVQHIYALEKSTGKTVWMAVRSPEICNAMIPNARKAYITPIIITVKGRDMLISNGSGVCNAYDPETGEELWSVIQGDDSTISSPFAENGLVFFYTGYVRPDEGERYAEIFAVNPDGHGDISETNLIWRMRTPELQLLTPVIKDGLIYTIDTRSSLICIEASSGDVIWTEKLNGKYNSSPVYAAGNIYFSSTRGETLIISEGRKFKEIARNNVHEQIWATPAILRNSILIRTDKTLYRVGS